MGQSSPYSGTSPPSPAAARASTVTRSLGRPRGEAPSMPEQCAPAALNARRIAMRQLTFARARSRRKSSTTRTLRPYTDAAASGASSSTRADDGWP